MGPASTLALALLLSASGAGSTLDTVPDPYADAATRLLVQQARARRQTQDSLVHDYRAQLRYRLSFGQGRRKWGTPVPVAVEEQVASVAWQRENDLRVDVTGRRALSRSSRVELSSIFDQPWFVPRDIGDSVRVVGADFPASGALHPLADGAEPWYRYAVLDSLAVQTPDGRTLRLIRVEVVPRRGGRPLVAGRLWLDAATAETVRFAFRYVGPVIWTAPEGTTRRDTTRAVRSSRLFTRFASLELDLEYGRQDGRYWMPSRQTISGRVFVPFGEGIAVPFEAVTTFDDYEINGGRPVEFQLTADEARDPARRKIRRDSLRTAWEADGRRAWGGRVQSWDAAGAWAGGRFEIHRPSNDSLEAFEGWTDSLALGPRAADAARVRETATDLETLVAGLPEEVTGISKHGFGYERIDDAFRFNRVQGNTLGAGYRVQVGAFSQLYATARFGFGDDRPTGRLALVRDAPDGKLTLAGFRDVTSVDPISSGRGLGATLNAVFVAHDYADYALTTGAAVAFETSLAPGLDLLAHGGVQDERSVTATSRARVNDFFGGSGNFQPGNPAVTEGWFGRTGVGLRGAGPLRWTAQGDLVRGAGQTVGRAWADARVEVGRHAGATLRVKAGVQTTNTLPQLAWRLGGPNTVRGFAYGAETGAGFWAAQLDVAPVRLPLRPVFFVDAGRAGAVDALVSGDVQVGGGVGLALYSRTLSTGFLRLDFSRPFVTGGTWRFDLVLGAVR